MSKCADCNELVGEEWSANNGLCSTCARDEVSNTDTYQASEDYLREQTRRSIARLVADRRGADNWNDDDYTTASNIIFLCGRLIRTEKLKLLAEVREQIKDNLTPDDLHLYAGGDRYNIYSKIEREYDSPDDTPDWENVELRVLLNELREEQLAALNKLEAEL